MSEIFGMRRSRWDIKGEREGPKEQSRRWGNHCDSQMNWNISSESESHPSVSSPPRQRATPSPIDYRSESRRRHDNQQDNNVPQSSTAPSHGPQQSLMGPPSTHFTASWPLLGAPNMFADSDRGHHAPPPFATHQRWAQAHPGYFQTDSGQYTFDMKWWAQQKQSMDAYLSGPSWRDDNKNTHPDSGVPQWSFGTRVMKNSNKRHNNNRPLNRNHHSDGNYNGQRHDSSYDLMDPRRRSSSLSHLSQKIRDGNRSSSCNHQLEGNYNAQRHDSSYGQVDPRRQPMSLSFQNQKFRDSLHDSRRRYNLDKRDFRKTSSVYHPPAWGNTDNVSGKGRGNKGGKKSNLKMQPSKFDVPGNFKSWGSFNRSIRPVSTSASLTEPRDDWSMFKNKSKEKIGKKTKSDESATYAEAAKKKALAAAASKLRRTFFAAKKKNVGGECSPAEDDDIDVDPTETTEENNAEDLSMPRRHPSCLEFDIDIRFSAKEWASVGRGQGGSSNILDIPQAPSRKRLNVLQKNNIGCGEEQEDSGTYSDTDVGRAEPHWSVNSTLSSSFTRRRHLSESSGVIDLRKNPSNGTSTSRPGTGRMRSCSMSLVEGAGSSKDGQGSSSENRESRMRLHLMPKLRRLMLKQLLTMDKKSLQVYTVLYLCFLYSNLYKNGPPVREVIVLFLQVREILALEQNGNNRAWEEVTFSLNDLLNADSDPDLDCQIISPPPRDPASTITIHDSDSEMEDLIEGESGHEEDDHEPEGREHEEDDHEDRESDHEDEDQEEEEEHEDEEDEEEVQHQVPVTQVSAETNETRNSISKREAATPHSGNKSTGGPLQMLPTIPVEVPLCVMESLGSGPSNTRDLSNQVSDSTLNLIASSQPPISNQRSAGENISVPGPSTLLLASPRLKVKEERPSPISECGLCMHNPRTPHTSECVYPYGLAPPSPVALMPGPPRPLGTTPPQRPVPHMPATQQPPAVPLSSTHYQRSIKQEKLDDSYLKYEHVKRPSSEERPKNPAPPDTLPLPPPTQGLHPPPHPRPLIFSPDNDFPDPPRPPPPPPPQFSPRIKIERHTPVQFMCCCMRNECERSSTHSAEMRPPSRRNGTTPQPTERRPTPHLYKMEPPSPCASLARTPHQSLPGHFAPPASPRCVNNVTTEARVTVGVQTEKEQIIPANDQGYNNNSSNNNNKRQYIPNLSLARSVTPLVTIRVDQSTSTDDLGGAWEQQQQRGKSRGKGWWWHRTGRPRNHLSQLTSISNSLSDFEFSQDAGIALQQMMVFSEQETEFVRHLESIDQEIHELMREKKRMTEELGRLQHLRIGKLQQLVRQGGAGGGITGAVVPRGEPSLRGACSDLRTPRTCRQDSSSDGGDHMDTSNSTTTYNIENISLRYGLSKEDVCVQSTTENASVVSSSQEKGPRVRSFSFSHTSSNDSSNESQTVRRQRCTSTCHSPGRSLKSKETFQITYLGPINPNEEFYQQIASNIHKLQQSISNTDSETDNDAKSLEVPVESSEANAFYKKDAREAASRNRSNSLSSSAEGDIESEVPVDHDEEEEERISRRRHKMCTDDGEAVVDSSEQHINKLNNESSQGDSEDLSVDKPQVEENESLGAQITFRQVDGGEIKKGGEELEYAQDHGSPEASQEPVSSEAIQELKPTEVCQKYELQETSHDSKSTEIYQESCQTKTSVIHQEPILTETCQESSFIQTTGTTVKEEFISTPRKSCSSASSSPSSSPDSQKSRNSSGEHCYSLRSRGPPSKIKQKSPGGQELNSEVQEENSVKTSLEKVSEKVGGEDNHADDEREKEDEFSTFPNLEGLDDVSEEKKRKRKRKTKKHRVNKRKKKKLPDKNGSNSPITVNSKRKLPSTLPSVTSSNSSLSLLGKVVTDHNVDTDEVMESSGDEHVFISPPSHGCAVLDIKVVGDFVITASGDGTARCYDMTSGRVMATYVDHTDVVTCVGVVGKPDFATGSQEFQVITGSADKTICIFNGMNGMVKQRCEVGEGVRCLDISWGQLFLGTEGGCGARWNFKDKGVTEMVQFCGKAVTSLKAMTEGGRRVLLVAAKTTPLMIRDAMTGLFLRTLEHIQLTVYATVSHGGLLYTGGSNKAIVYYDFTTGSSRGHIASEADVSCLSIYKSHLVATCYDGLVRIFCLATGQLLQRIPVEATNKMFICSALYKDRLLVGNKKGEVVGCHLPQLTSQPGQ
ncbi:uncharacterized protein [Cherax quadricarinatus]